MKKHILPILVLLLLSPLKSIACLNYYVIDGSGQEHLHDNYPPSSIFIHTKYDIKKLKATESQIYSAPASERYMYISNYCATLIKLGRHKEAIPVLENLLKTHPKEYELNANLAVAYELNGQLDTALALLKRSMAINPRSHYDSEWFHLNILESAITLRDKQLAPHDISVLRIVQDTFNKKIGYQISHQLRERIPLSQSPNKLLSKAIEECGDYYHAHISLEWAIELYAIAIGYSDDSITKMKLWDKINSSRQKLIDFKSQGKKGSVAKYLYKSIWQKKINQRINKWSGYTPYYYDKAIKTTF